MFYSKSPVPKGPYMDSDWGSQNEKNKNNTVRF